MDQFWLTRGQNEVFINSTIVSLKSFIIKIGFQERQADKNQVTSVL